MLRGGEESSGLEFLSQRDSFGISFFSRKKKEVKSLPTELRCFGFAQHDKAL